MCGSCYGSALETCGKSIWLLFLESTESNIFLVSLTDFWGIVVAAAVCDGGVLQKPVSG